MNLILSRIKKETGLYITRRKPKGGKFIKIYGICPN